MNPWSFSFSWPMLFLVLSLIAGSAWLGWANWHRRGKNRRVLALELLRFIAVTMLALTLLQPEWIKKIVRMDRPEIAILMDGSRSMTTEDVMSGGKAEARSEWLQRQKNGTFWKPLEAKASVALEDFAVTAAASEGGPESGSDLNKALDQAANRPSNLKAVLVLTDGDWNVGKSPVSAASLLRARNVPIYAVGAGSDQYLPDLDLQVVSPPAYGLAGEQISIPVLIKSHLPRDVKTRLTLKSRAGVEAEKDVVIPANGILEESLIWAPQKLGGYDLTMAIPVESDELASGNNSRDFSMAIRAETLKVLVIDSLPRWEYRFLRNALDRDPGVHVDCLLWHPGLGTGGGKNYLKAFPATKEEISKYDVVFLGDVGLGDGELKESDVELLKGLVEQQGSGLVFLPGRRGRQITIEKSALGPLIPVLLQEGKEEGLSNSVESSLQLTELGRRHFLTLLEKGESPNAAVWKGLPGFNWCAGVLKAKPGSEILAIHSNLRNEWGRMPLLVTSGAGSGHVMFMGIESAWRWRKGVEDKYHYRFWSQVVRWMAHKRHLAGGEGIRLTYSPENPKLGETIFMQASVMDQAGAPVREDRVTIKTTSPEGLVENFNLQAVEGGWGVFSGRFAPSTAGKYSVSVLTDKSGRKLEAEVIVAGVDPEIVGRPANFAVLKEIAEITRGEFSGTEGLSKMVEKIALLPEPDPAEIRIRLWSNPWWGGTLLAFLLIYWAGRKMLGMI